MEINKVVQWLENWLPGIGEPTTVHDFLHRHFSLDFSTRSEAIILGFQFGHSGKANPLHLLYYALVSTTIYPKDYRNSPTDVMLFIEAANVGRQWVDSSYGCCPTWILDHLKLK